MTHNRKRDLEDVPEYDTTVVQPAPSPALIAKLKDDARKAREYSGAAKKKK